VAKQIHHNTFQAIKEIAERPGCKLTVKDMCAIAGVSRAGYYKWLNSATSRDDREERDEAAFALILEVYNSSGCTRGARGIHASLLKLDPPVVINVKKIRRLMKKNGLLYSYDHTESQVEPLQS
jgi:hypothetical protein